MSVTTILVIDSDSKNLQILRESLESYDFRVTAVDNGIDAWGIIQSQKPDMVICEVDIPGINGFELQERLQKNVTTAGIPIVFLTNRRNLEDRIRSLRSGVKDYMIKPLHVKEVIARIQMILRRMERLRSETAVSETTETGKLEEKSIEDLIETYGMERKTGVLSIYDEHNRNGEIYFSDGMVVNARLGNFRAEKAVYQMLPWKQGQYTMSFKEIKVEEEIAVSNLGLLLQGFKRLQDREKLVEKLPSPDVVLVKTSIFEEILKKKTVSSDANKFISLFDGQRTISEVLAESIYDDLKTLEKTVQLCEQGFVKPVEVTAVSHVPEPGLEAETETEVASSRPAEPVRKNREAPRLPSFDLEAETPESTEPFLKVEPDSLDMPEKIAEEKGPDEVLSECTETEATTESVTEETQPEDVKAVEEETSTEGNQPFEETIAEGPVFEDASFEEITPPMEPVEDHSAGETSTSEESDLGVFFDSLFNGDASESGHLAIIGSDVEQRKELIAILTAGAFSVKSIGKDGEQFTEVGKIVTPRQKVLEVVGLSSDRILISLLDQLSSPMLGYVVLIEVDPSSNLGYWGYLLNSLKKKFKVPRTVAIRYSDKSNTMSLDSVRKSLRIGQEEQLVELAKESAGSVQLLLERLQTAKTLLRRSPHTITPHKSEKGA